MGKFNNMLLFLTRTYDKFKKRRSAYSREKKEKDIYSERGDKHINEEASLLDAFHIYFS